jgi:hypothetical protein
VDAAPDTRRQLGQIMVDEGFLTEDQLLDALAEQNRSGTPLGKVLVDLGFVSPGAVANALAEQHGGLLRTEYGTSAGLREMAGRAPIRTEAPQPTLPTPTPPAPQTPAAAPLGSGLRLAGPTVEAPPAEPAPVAVPAPVAAPAPIEDPAPVAQQPEQPAPAAEPEPAPPSAADTRIEQLESQLHAVLTERNSLAQSFNELQTRLSEAAQAHEAGVNAEVQERVGALEAQLQAAAANREELERAQQQAAERIAELEGRLAETAENRHELDTELQTLRTIAAGRDAALEKAALLEAELEQLRAHGNEDSSSQLQELAQQREAADARAHALENDLAQLREQTESEASRAAALEAELAALREHSSGHDENLAAQVSGLNEALQALTVERDAALQRAAALEPEVESLRDQLRDASAHAPVDGSHVDVSELQRQLAARERRLAESVGEIAKMNREHRALLQLVERQFQLEETTTSLPEPRGETAHVLFVPSATGYTLVERDGIAPEAGDIVEVDGGRYIVRRHGPSPLPGPRRRCAYLERA